MPERTSLRLPGTYLLCSDRFRSLDFRLRALVARVPIASAVAGHLALDIQVRFGHGLEVQLRVTIARALYFVAQRVIAAGQINESPGSRVPGETPPTA